VGGGERREGERFLTSVEGGGESIKGGKLKKKEKKKKKKGE